MGVPDFDLLIIRARGQNMGNLGVIGNIESSFCVGFQLLQNYCASHRTDSHCTIQTCNCIFISELRVPLHSKNLGLMVQILRDLKLFKGSITENDIGMFRLRSN